MKKKQNELIKYNIDNLMTISKYARMRGKERKTIYNWIKNDLITSVEFLGRIYVDKTSAKK